MLSQSWSSLYANAEEKIFSHWLNVFIRTSRVIVAIAS